MSRTRSWVGLGLVGVLSACSRPRTEIVAVVDSELPWGPGATVQSVSVEVRQDTASGRLHSLRTTALGAGAARRALPLAVGLLPPEEESDAAVWIEVRGCPTPDGCALGAAVVVQRAVVRFVAEQTVALPMLLASACVGVTCGAEQRCEPTTGRCVAATSAQATVGAYNGPGTSVGADATVRADVLDAGASDDRPDAVGRIDAGDAGGPTGERPDAGDAGIATGERPDVVVLDTGRDVVDSGTMSDVLSPPLDNGPCPSGQTLCGGMCRDLLSNADHCGACDRACSSSFVMGRACVAGACTGTCAAGRGNCDGDLRTNGCEVDLANTATHCGICANTCVLPNAMSACQAGGCRVATCFAGYGDCDGIPANGCEANINMGDVNNCGRCSARCPTPPTGVTALCAGGACRTSSVTCSAGTGNCDGNDGNGCETITATDVNNCGLGGMAGIGCGVRCPSAGGAASCAGGACSLACNVGLGDCDGNVSNGCETNIMITVAHCGRCGNNCATNPNTMPACVGSACTFTCSAGYGNCDAIATNGCEINLQTDSSNCGTCGRLCSGGTVCVGGTCSCPSGQTTCSGVCRSLQTDSSNCGTCNNICPAGAACLSGVCTASCTPPMVSCSGICRDRSGDPNNCGACGTVCTRTNGTAGCVSSACALTGCNSGFGNCDGNAVNGCEANLQTSPMHCGACGRACAAGLACTAGVCDRCPVGMQFIPAGMFQMGDPDTSTPVHGVQLSAFCIDTTEVTVAAWSACTDPGCMTPGTFVDCNWNVAGRTNHPINCVDWSQAQAYCRWRLGDLPTEAQWEYAARGTDNRLYPWGSTPVPGSQLCWNTMVTGTRGTCVVGSFAAGNSPLGLSDMSGNVREWVADWFGPYTGSSASYVMNPTGPASGSNRVHRGGSWISFGASGVRASNRTSSAPTLRDSIIGFRCARAAN